jgi:hypothetical protein
MNDPRATILCSVWLTVRLAPAHSSNSGTEYSRALAGIIAPAPGRHGPGPHAIGARYLPQEMRSHPRSSTVTGDIRLSRRGRDRLRIWLRFGNRRRAPAPVRALRISSKLSTFEACLWCALRGAFRAVCYSPNRRSNGLPPDSLLSKRARPLRASAVNDPAILLAGLVPPQDVVNFASGEPGRLGTQLFGDCICPGVAGRVSEDKFR